MLNTASDKRNKPSTTHTHTGATELSASYKEFHPEISVVSYTESAGQCALQQGALEKQYTEGSNKVHLAEKEKERNYHFLPEKNKKKVL